MAITFATDVVTLPDGLSSTITSNLLTLTSGDIITAVLVAESGGVSSVTPSNSGSALTWNDIATADNGTGDCYLQGWWAKVSDSDDRTVTITWTSSKNAVLYCVVHTGAHATTPVPAGKVYSGTNSTDVTQAITPTATGSALWMYAGDYAATNTFAAAANCTLYGGYHNGSYLTATGIRPTTQPRTDANAFTIGEADTGGKVSWIAFEVQAAASGPSVVPRMALLGVG